MAYSFYTIMQKRSDNKIYADLHKTNERIYFSAEEAQTYLDTSADYAEIRSSFHVVELVAQTKKEWLESLNDEDML